MVITGATATGKTVFSHKLFDDIGFSQIINADSKQVFKYLNIGSAKPSPQDIKRYNYKLVDFLEVNEHFSAQQFLIEVKANLQSDAKTLIVGGAGFYLDVLNKGLPTSIVVPDSIKKKVAEDLLYKGLQFLLDELREKDPEYFFKVDNKNHRRIVRAIEVIRSGNKTFTEIRRNRIPPAIDSFFIVIVMPRSMVNNRINKRVDEMINRGLFLEVETILKKGISPSSLSLSGIGYREVVDFLKNGGEREKVVENIKLNSRKYAKQQVTWFKTFKNALFLFNEEDFREELDKKDEWFYNIPIADSLQDPDKLLEKLKQGVCHRLSLQHLDFFYKCIEKFYEY